LGTVPKVWERRVTGLGTRHSSSQDTLYEFRCVRVEQEDHYRILRIRAPRTEQVVASEDIGAVSRVGYGRLVGRGLRLVREWEVG
jgi:hypothetical protein